MARNLLPVLLVTLACYTSLTWAAFPYPTVRRSDKVWQMDFDKTVTYADPYDWLEDPDSAETKTFVTAQNKLTQDYIGTVADKKAITESFEKLYNYSRYSIPVKHGDWYYITINPGLLNQGIIYRMKNLNDKQEVFIDPNTLSADGTTSLVFTNFSPDGNFVSFGTSKGGSDWITIGVYDTRPAKPLLLPDSLKNVKFAYTGWTKNNAGFFYAYFDEYTGEGGGTDTVVPTNQKLFYHKLGAAQKDDVEVFRYPAKPKLLIGTPIISQDGTKIFLFPTEGTSNTPWLYINFNQDNLVAGTQFEWKWVVEEANAEYFYVHQDEKCTYVRTNYQADTFQLVCVDLNNPDPKNWKTIIPTHDKWVLSDTVVVNAKAGSAKLIAVYMVDVVNMIQVYDLDFTNQKATYLFDVDTPIGTIQSIGGKREGAEFFFKVANFISPGIIYHYNFAVSPNKVKVFRQSTIQGLNTDEFETKQIKYKSKDGTMVPMFLVHRKDLVKNGKNPTMLYAYGGFNINIQPNYDVLGMFFVKHLNGVYAVANIRGGGEYGHEWHEAGMKLKKQNVFDDFNYAGKYLSDNKYSSRDYITINGRSNGGLLVGACSNQFGETFGAGLANVGVMDMVRFPLFTIGYAWREEYGDPQTVKADYDNVMKYSPLHSIPSNANYRYPNMLVLTADHDDRVVPAHSYKYIAELQNKLGKARPDTPLMIRIDSNSGHGSGKPISKWIEENTDITLFLLKSMNGRYAYKA